MINQPIIILLTAVKAESNLLREELTHGESVICGHLSLRIGILHGQRVAIGCCGIGKTCAAAATTTLLNHVCASRVIVLGCAGAYHASGLKVGDLAIASEEILGDEGVLTPQGFLDMEQMNLPVVRVGDQCYYNRFPIDHQWLPTIKTQLHDYAANESIQCLCGPFVSVSTCSGTTRCGELLQQRSGGIAENMEGAAVAQVCLQYQIPFSEIRAISNMVEDRDMSQWDLGDAMERAQHAVLHLLNQLNSETIKLCTP